MTTTPNLPACASRRRHRALSAAESGSLSAQRSRTSLARRESNSGREGELAGSAARISRVELIRRRSRLALLSEATDWANATSTLAPPTNLSNHSAISPQFTTPSLWLTRSFPNPSVGSRIHCLARAVSGCLPQPQTDRGGRAGVPGGPFEPGDDAGREVIVPRTVSGCAVRSARTMPAAASTSARSTRPPEPSEGRHDNTRSMTTTRPEARRRGTETLSVRSSQRTASVPSRSRTCTRARSRHCGRCGLLKGGQRPGS